MNIDTSVPYVVYLDEKGKIRCLEKLKLPVVDMELSGDTISLIVDGEVKKSITITHPAPPAIPSYTIQANGTNIVLMRGDQVAGSINLCDINCAPPPQQGSGGSILE